MIFEVVIGGIQNNTQYKNDDGSIAASIKLLTLIHFRQIFHLRGNSGGIGEMSNLIRDILAHPPTALIIDEPFLFHAAKEYLAQRGILAPSHVSLICADPDPTFAWCKPSVAHIRWDHRPVARRVVQWIDNVARHKTDLHQTLTKAEFIEGETVAQKIKLNQKLLDRAFLVDDAETFEIVDRLLLPLAG